MSVSWTLKYIYNNIYILLYIYFNKRNAQLADA